MSEFILQIEKLLSAFADPEYRYLAMEPVITYGLLAGIAMLVGGFFAKAPRLQVAALVVIGAAGTLYFPYRDARAAAQPRMEQVYRIESKARVDSFAKNSSEWAAASWQIKLLILCAFATLMIGIHRNRIGFGLALATTLLGLVVLKKSMWLNYQDALAYHPNLKRHEAPIDRGAPTQSPTAPREKSQQRKAAPTVAEPITPAAQVPVPPATPTPRPAKTGGFSPYTAPGTGTLPSSVPAPSPAPTATVPSLYPLSAPTPSSPGGAGSAQERIPAPLPPGQKSGGLFRSRKVDPLPRF